MRSAAWLEASPAPWRSRSSWRVRPTRSRGTPRTGRRVASIDAGRLPAGGAEQVWALPALTPGLYWVSLVLDGERVARTALVRR